MLIRFTQAARKHKIGKARVLHVINHADLAFTTPGGDGKAERTVWLATNPGTGKETNR